MSRQLQKLPEENENRAILYMVFSAFAGGVVAATIKSVSATLSPLLAFWFSRLFPLLGLIPMALQGKLRHLKTDRIWHHLLLNLLYVTAVLLNFYSLAHIPLVNASLLLNCAPLYTPLIAGFFLKEHFPPHLWWYVLLSFVGVLFVLQPGSSLYNPISLLSAISGILIAGAQVCNRHLAPKETPERVVFYMILLGPFLGTLPLAFFPKIFSGLSGHILENDILLSQLVLAGMSSWLFQLFRAKSAAHGKVSIVMPFSFLGVVFAGCFDWIFWGVTPNTFTTLGCILIFSGSLAILRHSRKKTSD